MVLFGLFFAATSFTKSMGPILLRDSPRWLKHIPSGIALFVTPPSFCSSLVFRSLPADRDFFSSCSAIGFLNTPSFSIARLLGGIIALRFSRGGKVPLISTYQSAHISSTSLLTLHNLLSSQQTVIVIASGFVLGEGLTSILGLGMKSAGVGVVSCFGCHLGGGGYCASC